MPLSAFGRSAAAAAHASGAGDVPEDLLQPPSRAAAFALVVGCILWVQPASATAKPSLIGDSARAGDAETRAGADGRAAQARLVFIWLVEDLDVRADRDPQVGAIWLIFMAWSQWHTCCIALCELVLHPMT
jgi:hypothetical protein